MIIKREEANSLNSPNSKTSVVTPDFLQLIINLGHTYNINRFGNLAGGFIIQNNLESVMKGTVASVTYLDAKGVIIGGAKSNIKGPILDNSISETEI